jgi:hypothetical protein
MSRALVSALLVGGSIVSCATTALAQPLGPDGSRIQTHDYSVDLFQGPVLASSRVTGLAGAYVAIAEGVDGNPQNPASPAVRVPWSFDHFDNDIGLSFSLPTVLSQGDFFNSGSDKSKDQQLFFLNVAVNLQLGTWGFGLTADLQQYGLDRAIQNDGLRGQFGLFHLIMANAFLEGQLLVGAGLRSVALSVVNTADNNNQLFSITGAGLEAGVLWRPNDEPFRVGAAAHSAVTTKPAEESKILYPGTGENELYLPNQVTVPWDVNVGVAVQLGPRPFNPRWYDPAQLLAKVRRAMKQRQAARERRRELLLARIRAAGLDVKAAEAAIDAELETQATLDSLHLQFEEQRADRILRERVRRMARSYVLISSSLVVTGKAENAVGIESFLNRTVTRSGQEIVFSPRLGAESEVVPNWVKLRTGVYVEPTRFERSSPRVHGTFGFDVKLLPWTVFGLFHEDTEWRLSGSFDLAEPFDENKLYMGYGVSIGTWH